MGNQLDKPQPVRAVRPNAGVRFRYQRQMLALIEEMNASILYWLEAQYKDSPPALAADAKPVPSKQMQKRFKELAKKWQARFDAAAPKIADAYLKGSFKATDSAMRAALKDAGVSVKFKMDAAMRDAFNASLDENVGLIKSIPSQYLDQVQGIVARAYVSGRDLESMVKELRKLYPKAQNRAVLIARDQSNKANSVVENARRLELGIEQAVWLHSGGGKHPRKNHVKASGTVYEIRKGCPIKDEKGRLEYIQPGQKINCRCVSRSVLPGLKSA
jgi:uncharacterized protein with gpF-like domain